MSANGICLHCGEGFIDTSRAQSRKFCSGRCRRRACAENARANCIACGVPLSAGSSWDGNERCRGCEVERRRELHRKRGEQIVAWWDEGLSRREIAGRLGWTVTHVSVELARLREDGYQLPYRRQPSKPKHPNLARAT